MLASRGEEGANVAVQLLLTVCRWLLCLVMWAVLYAHNPEVCNALLKRIFRYDVLGVVARATLR